VSFRAECERCAHDLHACLACRFYDTYADNACREVTADPVPTKDRNNLCEYYKPQGPQKAASTSDDDALQKLNAAFGLPAPAAKPKDPKAALEALFAKKPEPKQD